MLITMGRTIYTECDSILNFNFPGSAIYANFSGTKVSMLARPGSGSFIYTLDGQEPKRVEFDENVREIILADSLEDKEHSIEIMYIIEGYEHNPGFAGLRLSPGAKLTKKHQLPDFKILYIGNSITCGYGIESDNPNEGFSYATENHYSTYAAITARNVNAQWHSISRSGIGVYRNYGDKREGSEVTMPIQFERTLFDNPNYQWNHSDYQPDLICLNLGTNDTSLDNYDVDKLRDAYVSFVGTLREEYPNSKILLLTGSMMNGKALDDAKTSLDFTLNHYTEKGDSLIYRFDFSPQGGDLGYGADWHPSKAQHARMAEELTEYIKTTVIN